MSEAMVRASGGFSRDNMATAKADGKREGIAETKVGTAEANDVLTGKTFTNSSAVGAEGRMVNNGSYNITLSGRNSEAFIPQGYHSGSGRINVAQPQATKYLSSGDTGDVSLSPYDYRYVNASNVYKAGKDYAAAHTYFELRNYGAYTVNKDAYTETMSITNNTSYPMALIISATASVTASSDSYAVPVIYVTNGIYVDSRDAEYKSTNVRNKLVTSIYTVNPNTTAEVRIKAANHNCNMTFSVSSGRISA